MYFENIKSPKKKKNKKKCEAEEERKTHSDNDKCRKKLAFFCPIFV